MMEKKKEKIIEVEKNDDIYRIKNTEIFYADSILPEQANKYSEML